MAHRVETLASAEEAPLVSVLVVTYNRRGQLERALESVRNQSYRCLEVVIVDNGSEDGTAAWVRATHPEVRLIALYRNIGCPSGRNTGFAACAGAYIYQLDDDGWLHPDAVAECVRIMKARPDIAVAMSRIVTVTGPGAVAEDEEPGESEGPVPVFSGGRSMIRRDVLGEVGIYPDDFFRQAEESDLALRLFAAGYTCYCAAQSIMYHAPSSAGRDDALFYYYGLRNTNKTALRLFPFPYHLGKIGSNLVYALIYGLKNRDSGLPINVLRGLVADVWRARRERRPVPLGIFRSYRAWAKRLSVQRGLA